MRELDGIYEIRNFRESDRSFILATFLRGLYYGNEFFNIIPKHIFMQNYKRVAEALVNSPKNVIQVACLKEDSDTILGYSILSADFMTVHWVYVKSSETKIAGEDGKLTWRGKGIGKSLLPQFPAYYTHFSSVGLEIAKKFPQCVFNPFQI